MTDKKAAAHLFVALSKAYVDDPVHVHLVNGSGKGTRLAGCVGWAGDHWQVDVDGSASLKTLWLYLFHELAHVYHGDTPKGGVASFRQERALMRGSTSLASQKLFADYRAQDQEREDARTAWAKAESEKWWPALVGYLEGIEPIVSGG